MFARTPRLLLRPGWHEDAPALYAAINDEAVIRNLARAPWPYQLEDAQAFLKRDMDQHVPDALIFARTRGAPRLVGGCGIASRDDGRMELGYWIARPYWGLGFATEAATAMMRAARAAGLKDVIAGHMLDNPASGNVLRKIGFRPTGKVEQRLSRGRGETVTCVLYEDAGEAAVPEGMSLDMDDRALAA